MICGDLDSARPEVLEYYENKGVKIIKDSDQYSTDLMKCLKYADDGHGLFEKASYLSNSVDVQSPQFDVVIFGGLGGRADQAFSQLHHLYTLAEGQHPPWVGDLYLITKESLIFLLGQGPNKIHAPVKRQYFTENVGIIPLGRPSTISSRGLEWDVNDWPTEFGGQMSTSNHIKAETVEIESTERVLFTLELNSSCE